MRINSIELKNIGSYEGNVLFDTALKQKDKNIILIGGKNGAGKTTLFTAVRLCLYGYRSFGFKGIQSNYKNIIIKLINNKAKMHFPADAFVRLNLSISNGQNYDEYIITRSWKYENDSLDEQMEVLKNNTSLNEDDIADFENYILHLIPYELFNLYFFDGEKIADFFLETGGEKRIKNAFLMLCGYDTFDLMSKNFKRLCTSKEHDNKLLITYLNQKEKLEQQTTALSEALYELERCNKKIEEIDVELRSLEKTYAQSGGVSQKVWDEKFSQLKKEEELRAQKNIWFKDIAEKNLPFLILEKEIKQLKKEIENEENREKENAFLEVIKSPSSFEKLSVIFQKNGIQGTSQINKILDEITSSFACDYSEQNILRLSSEQRYNLLFMMKYLSELNKKTIIKEKKEIRLSLERTQKIRNEIERCNVDSISEYVFQKDAFMKQKEFLLFQRSEFEGNVHKIEISLAVVKENLDKIKKEYEEELKKNSINDISFKAMNMLEKLQNDLYLSQIHKVESIFKKDIKKMIRKEKFIDDIEIDNDFNIKIFRNVDYSLGEIYSIIKGLAPKEIIKILGERTANKLCEICHTKELKNVETIIVRKPEEWDTFQIEIDKTTLSKGEQQVFIMTLYKALMDLCSVEVPFVIDTPFARIDTEHRNNIAKNFFKALKGQIFILSTNEEVSKKHVSLLKDKIEKTFLLENTENTNTQVKEDVYFME